MWSVFDASSRRGLRSLSALAWLAATASRSLLDPSTGPLRAATDAGAAKKGNDYGEARTDGGADPRCAPDGGIDVSDCDGCELARCCATRFACYDDPGCNAADEAFDACFEAADADAGARLDLLGELRRQRAARERSRRVRADPVQRELPRSTADTMIAKEAPAKVARGTMVR
jgi:hypothetical protein